MLGLYNDVLIVDGFEYIVTDALPVDLYLIIIYYKQSLNQRIKHTSLTDTFTAEFNSF